MTIRPERGRLSRLELFRGLTMVKSLKNTIQTTMDSAGRLVLPKTVREEAGILPGMNLRITAREGRIEIEPVLRQVQVVQKGPLRVAVPVEEGPALTEATVEQVRREMRERNE